MAQPRNDLPLSYPTKELLLTLSESKMDLALGADTGEYEARTPVNKHPMVDSTHAKASAARYKRVAPVSS